MVLKHLDYWIVAQMALELVLMVLILIFLAKIKGLREMIKSLPPLAQQPHEALAGASASISETGGGSNLENVLAQLAQRSAMLQQHMSQLESRLDKIEPSSSLEEDGATLRSRVEQLFRRGIAPEEIARKLGMNLAEVKVALDLSRVGVR